MWPSLSLGRMGPPRTEAFITSKPFEESNLSSLPAYKIYSNIGKGYGIWKYTCSVCSVIILPYFILVLNSIEVLLFKVDS